MTKRLYSYTLYTWKQNTPTMMIRRIKSRNKTVFIYEKERERGVIEENVEEEKKFLDTIHTHNDYIINVVL